MRHRALLVLLLLCLSARAAVADCPRDLGLTSDTFDLQIYKPALEALGYLTVNAPRTLGHGRYSLSAAATWAFQPLYLQRDPAPPCVVHARSFEVRHLVTPQATFALGLGQRFEVAAAVPVGILAGRRQICDETGCHGYEGGAAGRDDLSFRHAAVGDLGLSLKVHVLRAGRSPLDLGALLTVTLPVSAWFPEGEAHKIFLAEPLPTLRPQILLERTGLAGGRLRVGGAVGALVRFRSGGFFDSGEPRVLAGGQELCYPADYMGGLCGTQDGRSVGTQVSYAAAAALTVFPGRLELLAEVYGLADVTGENRAYPVEAAGAARLWLAESVQLDFGWGGGLTGAGQQTGASGWRALAALRVAPSFAPQAPPDSDGDGVPDARDACPKEPEDRDGFEDQDGCPDPDNDRDGVPDLRDRCPMDAEDRDGFEDQDGCPDPDNDRDGLADVQDRCPGEPEDRDGFEDQDGCPDPDNDRDGVLDGEDACRDVPGVREQRGCPDPDGDKDGVPDRVDQCPTEAGVAPTGCAERRYIVVKADKIDLKQKIHFATAKARIFPDSYPLLDEVVDVLKQYPKMELRIEGHTDSRGRAALNTRLSQDRARAVRDYLINKGVAAERLTAEGYGPKRPLASNDTEDGREKNRRTEFFIVKQ